MPAARDCCWLPLTVTLQTTDLFYLSTCVAVLVVILGIAKTEWVSQMPHNFVFRSLTAFQCKMVDCKPQFEKKAPPTAVSNLIK